MPSFLLGPNGAFENGNIGVVKRRVSPYGVVNAVPPRLSKPKPQKTPRTPRVADLLRKAMEWQELLEYGKGVTQADIARREDLSRARVTQIMDLLNLAPDIKEYIPIHAGSNQTTSNYGGLALGRKGFGQL